jgi:hypothetical protein
MANVAIATYYVYKLSKSPLTGRAAGSFYAKGFAWSGQAAESVGQFGASEAALWPLGLADNQKGGVMVSLPDPLHPALVHFPIVLLLLGAAVAVLSALVNRGRLARRPGWPPPSNGRSRRASARTCQLGHAGCP